MTIHSLSSALQSTPNAALRQQAAEQESRAAHLHSFAETLLTPGKETEPTGQDETAQGLPKSATSDSEKQLQETFQRFVGQTFFGQMLATLRKSVGKPAFFHGGRGEEIFQSQMDQLLVEEMSEASAEQFAKPMYELFNLNRKG